MNPAPRVASGRRGPAPPAPRRGGRCPRSPRRARRRRAMHLSLPSRSLPGPLLGRPSPLAMKARRPQPRPPCPTSSAEGPPLRAPTQPPGRPHPSEQPKAARRAAVRRPPCGAPLPGAPRPRRPFSGAPQLLTGHPRVLPRGPCLLYLNPPALCRPHPRPAIGPRRKAPPACSRGRPPRSTAPPSFPGHAPGPARRARARWGPGRRARRFARRPCGPLGPAALRGAPGARCPRAQPDGAPLCPAFSKPPPAPSRSKPLALTTATSCSRQGPWPAAMGRGNRPGLSGWAWGLPRRIFYKRVQRKGGGACCHGGACTCHAVGGGAGAGGTKWGKEASRVHRGRESAAAAASAARGAAGGPARQCMRLPSRRAGPRQRAPCGGRAAASASLVVGLLALVLCKVLKAAGRVLVARRCRVLALVIFFERVRGGRRGRGLGWAAGGAGVQVRGKGLRLELELELKRGRHGGPDRSSGPRRHHPRARPCPRGALTLALLVVLGLIAAPPPPAAPLPSIPHPPNGSSPSPSSSSSPSSPSNSSSSSRMAVCSLTLGVWGGRGGSGWVDTAARAASKARRLCQGGGTTWDLPPVPLCRLKRPHQPRAPVLDGVGPHLVLYELGHRVLGARRVALRLGSGGVREGARAQAKWVRDGGGGGGGGSESGRALPRGRGRAGSAAAPRQPAACSAASHTPLPTPCPPGTRR
jgi:hypothetical protein